MSSRIAEHPAEKHRGPVGDQGLLREEGAGGDVDDDLDDSLHLPEITDLRLDRGERIEHAPSRTGLTVGDTKGVTVHLIAGVTGTLPAVVQHDTTTADYVLGFDYAVLSPGPGHPANRGDFAVGGEVLRAGTVPVLGVCLGRHAIGL